MLPLRVDRNRFPTPRRSPMREAPDHLPARSTHPAGGHRPLLVAPAALCAFHCRYGIHPPQVRLVGAPRRDTAATISLVSRNQFGMPATAGRGPVSQRIRCSATVSRTGAAPGFRVRFRATPFRLWQSSRAHRVRHRRGHIAERKNCVDKILRTGPIPRRHGLVGKRGKGADTTSPEGI